MQLQELKPIHRRKKRKRVGRGGKRGSYCGRGIKGQRARSGRRLKPVIRELIKKYPKLRGYRSKRKGIKPVIVNIETLEKKFQAGELVTPKTLVEKKIIQRVRGKIPKVKILAKGKLSKPLTIKNCFPSQKAKEIIKKARQTH